MAEHTLDWLCAAAAEMAAEVAAAIAGTGDEGAGGEGAGAAPSLLELYCGNGNHTVALARHFGRLLAVEIDPRLCEAAEHNLAQNGVTTASVLCAPSARFCGGLLRKLSGAAEGARGADRYDALLVDPPRAGLDQTTLSLVQKFDQVLYTATLRPATLLQPCNPAATLRPGALHQLQPCDAPREPARLGP